LQLRFPDELLAVAGVSYVLIPAVLIIESLTFLSIPQLGKVAPEDLVTYQMVTAGVGLPDAVY